MTNKTFENHNLLLSCTLLPKKSSLKYKLLKKFYLFVSIIIRLWITLKLENILRCS